MISLQNKLANVLKLQGDLYSVEDIIEHINDGRMQSFAQGDTWIVTQVNDYPQKRVLNIFLVVGNMEDVMAAESRLDEFAKEVGASSIVAFGRSGWKSKMHGNWQHQFCSYEKAV